MYIYYINISIFMRFRLFNSQLRIKLIVVLDQTTVHFFFKDPFLSAIKFNKWDFALERKLYKYI